MSLNTKENLFEVTSQFRLFFLFYKRDIFIIYIKQIKKISAIFSPIVRKCLN